WRPAAAWGFAYRGSPRGLATGGRGRQSARGARRGGGPGGRPPPARGRPLAGGPGGPRQAPGVRRRPGGAPKPPPPLEAGGPPAAPRAGRADGIPRSASRRDDAALEPRPSDHVTPPDRS